jgi:alpha-beta hydrolase superfamily lysophospholipase
MIILFVLKMLGFLAILASGGWILFSFAAGLIVYLTTLTTAHANLESGKLSGSGGNAMSAHTKDPRIMAPLNAAKSRWYRNRDDGAFELLSVVSRDGLLLSGYLWRAGAEKERMAAQTVILVHGMHDSAAGLGYLAEEYHKAGWDVLSTDLRSHGESEGVRRTMGFREAEDLALWVDLLVREHGVERLFLHGISMGGSTVLLYGENRRRISGAVRGIIADSSFSRYDETFRRLLKRVVRRDFLVKSIEIGASVSCFLQTGVSFGQMSPGTHIGRCAVPLLLFHGQKDELVPIALVRDMLGEAVKHGAVSVVIPEAPHIGPYFYAPALYMQKIGEFARRFS